MIEMKNRGGQEKEERITSFLPFANRGHFTSSAAARAEGTLDRRPNLGKQFVRSANICRCQPLAIYTPMNFKGARWAAGWESSPVVVSRWVISAFVFLTWCFCFLY